MLYNRVDTQAVTEQSPTDLQAKVLSYYIYVAIKAGDDSVKKIKISKENEGIQTSIYGYYVIHRLYCLSSKF